MALLGVLRPSMACKVWLQRLLERSKEPLRVVFVRGLLEHVREERNVLVAGRDCTLQLGHVS